MLHALGPITGNELQAQDGVIGRCRDFLFDDTRWRIRYMVAATGRWLAGRKMLVSPVALGRPDWEHRRLPVRLTRTQLEAAPALDEGAPVSRRWERAWFRHFGFPNYWDGLGSWGLGAPSGPQGDEARSQDAQAEGDPHLRSTGEVTGYQVEAADGAIGHVAEFIVDDEDWTIRYLVVDTRDPLPGRKVLIAPEWVDRVDWSRMVIAVELTRQAVRESPPWDPDAPVNREYEERLYGFYGRPVR
ncbi:MAG: PRC-barrel domain-containing protein [Candidatus Krumholzibacteriia bacterium]